MPSPIALITLADAKAYLKVEHDLEDDLISGLIDQVTSRLERRYDRIFVARDFSQTVYSDDEFLWINFPIISIESVRHMDEAAPMPADEFTFDRGLGHLRRSRWAGYYEVIYRAGYEAADLPDWIRSEAFELLSHLYEGRGGEA